MSDFHPCKAELLAYPGTEVLVIYDPDFDYGENFCVCLTEDAKATQLQVRLPLTSCSNQLLSGTIISGQG